MSNIFRSKEVYKHPNYNVHDKNEMIPVRGVYVSGEYRPPFYNEPILRIDQISSTNCEIIDYTTKYEDINPTTTLVLDHLDIETTEWQISRYTEGSVDLNPSFVLGLCNIQVREPNWVIDRYEKSYIDSSPDRMMIVGVFGIEETSKTIIRLGRSNQHSTPESILRITGLTTEPATITNHI